MWVNDRELPHFTSFAVIAYEIEKSLSKSAIVKFDGRTYIVAQKKENVNGSA